MEKCPKPYQDLIFRDLNKQHAPHLTSSHKKHMKIAIYWTMALAVLHTTCVASLEKAFERESFNLPESVVRNGQFITQIDDALLLIGGVDANGSLERSIFVLHESTIGNYEQTSKFSFAESPGACNGAPYKDGVVLAAATDSTRVLHFVEFKENTVSVEALPSLPKKVKVLGLDFIENLLCVFVYDEDSRANIFYNLDMEKQGAGWSESTDFTGSVIEAATVRANYGMLHIFAKGTTGKAAQQTNCYGWRPRPLDGTEQSGWIELAPIPFPVTESTSFITGQAHMGLLSLKQDSLSPSATLLIYHSITDTWVDAGSFPWASGALVPVRLHDSIVFAGSGNTALPSLRMLSTVGNLKTPDYIVMLLYFLVLAAIGIYFARKHKSSAGFSIGGGKVAWWAAAISMFATGASAISFMAIPSQVFRTSLVWLLPVIIFIPFYFVQAYLIYPLLRRLNIVSTYEYLQRRFHPALRMLASLQCIAFQTFGRISVVILLPALAISAATGVDVTTSVLLMGLVTTLYTTFGGYEAVVWTDVLQGLLMIGGIALMIGFAISGLPGGFDSFVAIGQQYNKFDLNISGWDVSMALGSFLIVRQLAEQFAQTADQPIIQRVFSTPLKQVRKLAAMFACFSILIMVLVQFMGLSMFGFFHGNPEKLDPFMSNDQIVPLFVTQTLPPGMAGLIIAALFAASMSSLSSSVNSVSTLIAEDFYCKFVPEVSDRKKLFLLKAASLFIGLFGTGTALLMAKLDIRSMFQVWFEIAALIGGGFVGMYFLGMLTRRANSLGVAIGAVSSIFCLLLVKNLTPIHWSLYQVIAIASCVIVGYVSSLLIPSREKDLTGLTVFTPADDR
jgi:SSS family transporter